MNGHVFQCFNESSDPNQFEKSVEVLGEYASKKFKHAGDLATFFKDLEIPELTMPEEFDEKKNTSKLALALWNKEVDSYSGRLTRLNDNLKALYAVAWGQCSDGMKAKLKTSDDYEQKHNDTNVSWLLKEIRGVTFGFESQRSLYLSLQIARKDFYSFKQGADVSMSAYLQTFRTKVDILEHYGGGSTFGQDDNLIQTQRKADSSASDVVLAKKSRSQALAHAFLFSADKGRYGTLLADLENQFARGNNQYPTDLSAAYSMLVGYRAPPAFSTPRRNPAGLPRSADQPPVGLTFAQTGSPIAGTDGVSHPEITCYACQHQGHYSNSCPTPTAVQLFQTEATVTETDAASDFTFAQLQHALIPKHWVLLDSQSTVSVFNNPSMLRNIRRAPTPLKVYTNGGCQESHLIGDIRNFGTVWFNPDSLANILSLAAVRKTCRVTMDTSVEAALCVHRSDGTIMKFLEYASGLYYHDTSQPKLDTPSTPVIAYSFLSTVARNKSHFTPREVEGADAARNLYKKIGRPSQQAFEDTLRKNLIMNCPVTIDDAKRALIIYGPDVAVLKGKTTRGKSPSVPITMPIHVPESILKFHQQVHLCADIFYVQGIRFFHTISKKLKFRTISTIESRKHPVLLRETTAVMNQYKSRGFEVVAIHSDRELECLRNDILPTDLQITAADAHQGDVERSIRTIKERTRTLIHGMPYRRFPTLMVKEIVNNAVKGLNLFPVKGGVSDTLSPRAIVGGLGNPDYNKMKLEFGAYTQVFEDNNPTNTTATRMTGAIALNHTGNAQGDYYFMSLTTGERLHRHKWTELPVTQAVIEAVEGMAEAQGQPRVVGGLLKFEWRPNAPIEDLDEDDFEDDDGEGIEEAVADPPPAPDYHEEMDFEDDNEEDPHHAQDQTVEDTDGVDDFPAPNVEDDSFERGEQGAHNVEDGEDDEDQGADETDFHDEQPEDTADDADSPYGLRPNRTRDYSHRFGHDDEAANVQLLQQAVEKIFEDPSDAKKYVFGHVMTQMTATAGIKKHGQEAVDALFKEFAQLDDKRVFQPLDASSLSHSEKCAALRAVNLIKEKRSGELKGRTCADGRPQRTMFTKEETTSPTVSTDALMMTLMIAAMEKRDVATADVEGAYLHANMTDVVIMKLTGEAVDIMCAVNPGYEVFVTIENRKKVLYVQLMKALYGCVKSALLWYDLFSSVLVQRGFVLNPYDPCVANCVISGKQCTIAWYVDDNLISHCDPAVVTEVIELIEARFGKMTVTRGKRHTFLGMDIVFNEDGTVSIDMQSYIKESFEAFGEDVSRGATSPASKTLFEVDKQSEPLSIRPKEVFHSIVQKLLYVSHRGRPDIQLTISFLCTRVSRSTVQDWVKLKRLLQYLHNTIELNRVLGADDLSVLRTWVDASYAVHEDMKSHTGGAISMGRGAFMCKATKQKLNTKSSTEAELVGASDYLPSTIWARMFLEAQGYTITTNTFYQDNQSAMRLERNGRASAGQKSRHIDIRYFFITDRISGEKLSIEHCPTEEMLADFFTKPLQGALFRKFRGVILGHEHVNTLSRPLLPPSEERVGKVSLDVVELVGNGQTTKKGNKYVSKIDTAATASAIRKTTCAQKATYAEVARRGETKVGVSFFLL